MKVLVTGSQGFIAKNLLERLSRMDDIEVSTFSRDESSEILEEHIQETDFIFHLAGANRPKNSDEYYTGNRDLTEQIVALSKKHRKRIPVLMTSSIQIENNNDYGKSKRMGEIALERYAEEAGTAAYIYRLPNVFGKWSRPNYNTVIATWCHNITRGQPIQINDESVKLYLVYVDDVVEQFVHHLDDNGRRRTAFIKVSPIYTKTLGEIKDLIYSFRDSRQRLLIPRVGRGFERALYATYLSFLPTNKFSYPLDGHKDERGTFFEFLKTTDSGQVSISTTAPGVTRGNHYHNTKNEKFLVIKGEASIKHRQIHTNHVIEYKVSDRKMEVIEMIPGYTHNITNTGDCEMVLLIWANEAFDKDNPDTYRLKVSCG